MATDRRIMVVDDDADILHVIQQALRKWDLFSDGFTNPIAALEHFKQHAGLYALVISDLKMPKMTGFQFIEEVTKVKPDVKIMVMTAYFRDMLQIPNVLEGIVKVDSVLQKPVGIHKICEQVRSQLNIA
jgi:DNA-binding NtrC family response regulator